MPQFILAAGKNFIGTVLARYTALVLRNGEHSSVRREVDHSKTDFHDSKQHFATNSSTSKLLFKKSGGN